MGLLKGLLKTLASGLLAMLPLIVTVAVLAWGVKIVHDFVGPQSLVGRALLHIGLNFADERWAYGMGVLVFVALAYVLGLIVQSRFESQVRGLADRTLKRVPLIGPMYDMTSRFVGLIDRKQATDLRTMSPVWCFFGGPGGVAVLALMPSPEAVELEGVKYVGVMVPTAPVPFGGGLLYVPESWVKPTTFGVDRFTSVYVSMGVVTPIGDRALPGNGPGGGPFHAEP